ncbi:MAG: peroxiredoxin [Gemmatimonadota bacterium]
MIERIARAEWKGSLKGGSGVVRAGALEGRYSFASRFQDAPGTTPEELVGAAHAGCFSMALSLLLGEHGFTPQAIQTTATVSLDADELRIARIELKTRGWIQGLDDADEFRRLAEMAKEVCPISRALAGTDIRLQEAELFAASPAA